MIHILDALITTPSSPHKQPWSRWKAPDTGYGVPIVKKNWLRFLLLIYFKTFFPVFNI